MPMRPDKLKEHIFSTYKNVRFGIAAIGFGFPFVLGLLGYLYGIDLQNSMSAYYWAASTGYPPMRIWFVGILFVVGVLLYLYKGFSDGENWALNAAAACAFGIALFPMPWDCAPSCARFTVHGAFAVVLFVCIAYVAIRCTEQTLRYVRDERLKHRYRVVYRISGACMAVSPLIAFVLALVFNDINKYVLAFEATGLWAFGVYWWTKSAELAHSGAELLALHERIAT